MQELQKGLPQLDRCVRKMVGYSRRVARALLDHGHDRLLAGYLVESEV